MPLPIPIPTPGFVPGGAPVEPIPKCDPTFGPAVGFNPPDLYFSIASLTVPTTPTITLTPAACNVWNAFGPQLPVRTTSTPLLAISCAV